MELTAKNLREMNEEELLLRAAELQKQMFDVRQKLITKEENNTSLLKRLKRDYARLLTILNEKKPVAAAH